MNSIERSTGSESVSASIGRSGEVVESCHGSGVYRVRCTGPVEHRRAEYVALRDKMQTCASKRQLRILRKQINAIPLEEKWADTVHNLWTTVGKNDILDKYLAGSAYTAAWYLGLISSTSYTTGPAVGDTSASHGGWTEDQSYSQGTRPAPSFAAASGGSKSTSVAVAFSINAGVTIKGCFLISNSTKGGTTGVLFSAGLFSGGDKILGNGDTLNVSYTAQQS